MGNARHSLGRRLRAALFNLIFYLNLAAFLILGLPLFVLSREVAIKVLKLWGRTTQWWLHAIVGTRLEVRGREHLPRGPLIVAAKHQSAWDTAVLHMLFDDPAMVLKKELTLIPLFGWFILKFGLIPVNRSAGTSAMRKLAARAKAEIARGRQILIFPEGTRRPPGADPDYKPGVALLYRELGVPCLPLALNSGLFWPRRRADRHPGTLVVEFLPPIPPGLDRRAFMARLQSDIETASDRLLKEAANRHPELPLEPEATARLAEIKASA